MIYFLKNNNYIKIGYSKDPKKRIASLQTSIPETLECVLLIDGGYAREYELHNTFSHLRNRLSGEWFILNEEILNFIEDNLLYDRKYEYGLVNKEFSGNEQLKRLRHEHGLTLRDVGDKLGITPQSVVETEQREAEKSVTLNALDRVASVLGYKLEYRFVPLIKADKLYP